MEITRWSSEQLFIMAQGKAIKKCPKIERRRKRSWMATLGLWLYKRT